MGGFVSNFFSNPPSPPPHFLACIANSLDQNLKLFLNCPFLDLLKWPSVELVVKFHRSNLTHTILTEFDLFVSTLIHPDATVIPEVSSILRDDFVHSDSYEQPICDLAKPKFFELEVIDDLSVSLLKVSLVFVSCFLLLFSIC